MGELRTRLGLGDRLVCIGDSITADDRGYVSVARDVWAARDVGVEVLNVGRGGDTARQMRARFETDVISLRPTWVSLMVGMADTIKHLRGDPDGCDVGGYQEMVGEMVALAVGAGARVALCTPNHMEYFGHGEGMHRPANAMLAEKAQWLRDTARAGGHLLVPTGEVLLEAQRQAMSGARWLPLTTDGVHLNDLGRALTAVAFVTAFGYDLALDDPRQPTANTP